MFIYFFVVLFWFWRKFNYIAEFQEKACIKPKLSRRVKLNCRTISIRYFLKIIFDVSILK